MTMSVLWTLLPSGISADGTRATLSLVASPRVLTKQPGDSVAADSLIARWPTVVAGLGSLTVVTAGSTELIPVTITSPRPDQALWDRLLPPDAPALPYAGTAATPIFAPAESAFPFGSALSTVDQLYAATADPQRVGDHPVRRVVTGLAEWLSAEALRATEIDDLLDPRRLTAARLNQAQQALREQGRDAAADVVALVPVLRRLQAASAASAVNPPQPGHLSSIPTLADAELHQIIGLLMDHPALAVRVGLRIDLSIPVFHGDRLIRIGDAQGRPLHPDLRQPWSAVRCTPAARSFTMATQPGAPGTEVQGGQLDLRPNASNQHYVITDVDPVPVVAQLATLAGTANLAAQGRAAAGSQAAADTVPTRRDAGIILAQYDRCAGTFAHVLARNARFDSGMGPAEVQEAPVLYADDVTAGYRVDVAKDDGPFRSLMRRRVKYTVESTDGKAPQVIEVKDEGSIDPFSPIEQRGPDGSPHLFVNDEVFTFDGWSLVARKPGRTVGAEPGQPEVTDPDRRPVPGMPLLIDVAAEPGSLTPLRYGAKYRFRVRTADFAGNSIDPQIAGQDKASMPFRFRRLEPVPAPALVPRAAFQPGESLRRIVVRSDGDGNPLGTSCERHIAPAKASQHLVERHGMFDSAFGSTVPQGVRDRMLALAKREQGTFLDEMVPGPDGVARPAEGIAIVTNVGAPPPVSTLPIPRGEPLADGEYVVHNTDTLVVPYLADPLSTGSAWAGLPGTTEPVVVPWHGSWPDVGPHRLVVRAGQSGRTTIVPPPQKGGRSTVEVVVPPAAEVTVALSSALSKPGLAVIEPLHPAIEAAALAGQIPWLTPAEQITLVHAVRKPLIAPTIKVDPPPPSGSSPDRPLHSTSDRIKGTVTAHASSTSTVDIEGTWTEIIDRGFGPVRYEQRRAVAGTVRINPDTTGPVHFDVRHHFGDTKRRIVSYRAVGTTRFREYFPVAEPGDRSMVRESEPAKYDVRSTRRPEPPRIHSVIPLRRYERSVIGNQLTCIHETIGVRVYLRRPWFTTGEGELLGVSVTQSQGFGDNVANSAYRDLISQWGSDPYEINSEPAPHLVPAMIANRVHTGLSADLPDNPEGSLGHAVAGVEVQFDAERDLWFADIEFDMDATKLRDRVFPMVRLSLVRYQPGTSEFHPECSATVLTDFIGLPPTRYLHASKSGTDRINVSVQAFGGSSFIEARWQTRLLDANAKDICVDAPGVEPKWIAPVSPTGTLCQGVIRATATGADLDRLMAGRILIEERREAWSVADPASTSRVVWTDVIDIPDFTAQ
ncbi:hypothetical protein DMH04_09175 [Kibdelosporangium aridum]|uniref:Uncharacterized protein n=1 Tax=Kibdelosporangium aridum TaxID=2030 RepID=A0A428ZIJ9_KIBAR|nr:hypothetical protein [Kibdelosporangium aridum]RSM87887.1 hypothetical protein DMH04_09175 [Kibdelosporangium aridum]